MKSLLRCAIFCRPLEQQMANLECNAVCGVAITHHFLAKMASATLNTIAPSILSRRLYPVST